MIGKPLRGVTGLHPISLDIEVAPIEASNTQPITTPPASAWNKVLEMKFNNNFNDSTGRHSPVSYGAVTSNAQSVEGGYSMYANRDGYVVTDGSSVDHSDFNIGTGDIKIVCDIRPSGSGNHYVWMKATNPFTFGYCIRLLDQGGGSYLITLRDSSNVGILDYVTSSLVNTWTNLEVVRESDVWKIYLDSSLVATSPVYWPEEVRPASATGMNGFTIAGRYGEGVYSGYIDNFVVYTK